MDWNGIMFFSMAHMTYRCPLLGNRCDIFSNSSPEKLTCPLERDHFKRKGSPTKAIIFQWNVLVITPINGHTYGVTEVFSPISVNFRGSTYSGESAVSPSPNSSFG